MWVALSLCFAGFVWWKFGADSGGDFLLAYLEELYRDIRPLRIYEGTTEIQKLIIARTLLPR